MIYFSSDLHFYHKNIIEYCNRPFVNVDEMNQTIISNFRNVVTDNDLLILVGDISFGNEDETYYAISHLPGTKILVRGNHDKVIDESSKIQSLFHRIANLYEFYDKPTKSYFVACHYPMFHWNKSHKGSYHVHGHNHGNIKKYPFEGRLMDIGVDTNKFMPYSLDDVIKNLSSKTFNSQH